MPSASSPAVSNDRGPFIAPIRSGMRSCTGRANVKSPLYWKKSPWKVIAPSSRNVRMTCSASFRRDSGLRFCQSIPYWAIRPKLPVETTHSALPPDSSSSVASAWQMSVGSRRKTCVTLGPKRMFCVLSAAAPNSTQRSLCQVSSTE